jgi:hypothetical protein
MGIAEVSTGARIPRLLARGVRGRQRSMLGAQLNEIGVVALFLVMVLLSSKVGKIGEAVGGLFERRETDRKKPGDP